MVCYLTPAPTAVPPTRSCSGRCHRHQHRMGRRALARRRQAGAARRSSGRAWARPAHGCDGVEPEPETIRAIPLLGSFLRIACGAEQERALRLRRDGRRSHQVTAPMLAERAGLRPGDQFMSGGCERGGPARQRRHSLPAGRRAATRPGRGRMQRGDGLRDGGREVDVRRDLRLPSFTIKANATASAPESGDRPRPRSTSRYPRHHALDGRASGWPALQERGHRHQSAKRALRDRLRQGRRASAPLRPRSV